MSLTIRPLLAQDAQAALSLYRDLVGKAPVADTTHFVNVVSHPGTMIIGVEDRARLVAMVTLHVLPNMTQGGRPYALIENVVTDRARRGQGLGRVAMQAAIDAAWAADAYKIMLMTGQTAGARGFYERLGFSAEEKWGMTLRRAPVRAGH